jgi:hypothetical protein
MSTVEALEVSAFTIPTDAPESDGTLEWDSTTIVVVEARSGATRGLGWTYAPEAAGRRSRTCWPASFRGDRSKGSPRSGSTAERSCRMPDGTASRSVHSRPSTSRCGTCTRACSTCRSSPSCRQRATACPSTAVAVSARTRSSGSVSSSPGGWNGVKMKLGRDPRADPARLDAARAAIGDADLCVDANGAFATKEAVRWAARYVAEWHVRWFEEPSLTPHFAQ